MPSSRISASVTWRRRTCASCKDSSDLASCLRPELRQRRRIARGGLMSAMFKITLPDGSVKEMPVGSSPADVAASIGPGLAKAALAAKVDGELRDLNRPFDGDSQLALVTSRDEKDALELVRHDFAHV